MKWKLSCTRLSVCKIKKKTFPPGSLLVFCRNIHSELGDLYDGGTKSESVSFDLQPWVFLRRFNPKQLLPQNEN